MVAVQRLEPLAQVRVDRRLDGLGAALLERGKLSLEALDLGRAGANGRAHLGRRAEDGVEVRFLRQHADRCAGRGDDAAAVGLLASGDDLEQRGLAGAVGADQADALASRDARR